MTKRKNTSISVGHCSKRAKSGHEEALSDEDQHSNAQVAYYRPLTSHSLTVYERSSASNHPKSVYDRPLNSIPVINFLCIVAPPDPDTGTLMFPSVDGTSLGKNVLTAHVASKTPNLKGRDLTSIAQTRFHQSRLFSQLPPVEKMLIIKLHEPLLSDDYQKLCSQLLQFTNHPIEDMGIYWPIPARIPSLAPNDSMFQFVVAYPCPQDMESFEPLLPKNPTSESESDKQDDVEDSEEDSDKAGLGELYHALRASLGIELVASAQGVVASRKLTNDARYWEASNGVVQPVAPSLASRVAELQGTDRRVDRRVDNGRHPHNAGSGTTGAFVGLYNDVFAEFLRTREECRNDSRGVAVFTDVFLKSIYELVEWMRLRTGRFGERDQVDAIVKTLKHLLEGAGLKLSVRERTQTGPEPDIVLQLVVYREGEEERETPLVVFEIKPGGSKHDAMVQATRGWLEILKDLWDKKTVTACCGPCFLISFYGTSLAVGGAALPNRPVAYYLTGYELVPYGAFPTDHIRMFELACTFAALQVSLGTLIKMYKELYKSQTPAIDITVLEVGDISTQAHPRFFPWPRSFVYKGKGSGDAVASRRVAFRYIRPLRSANFSSVFKVQVVAPPDPEKGEVDPHPTDDEFFRAIPWLSSKDSKTHGPVPVGSYLVVKFVLEYGSDAHHAMAKADKAPKLYSCEPFEMCGGYQGLQMVVMGFVEGRTLADVSVTTTIKEDVKKCVGVLHQLGFVHGDLCEQNFIVDKGTGSVVMIGFDTAVLKTDKDEGEGPQHPHGSSLTRLQRKLLKVPEGGLDPWRSFERCNKDKYSLRWSPTHFKDQVDRTISWEVDSRMLASMINRLTGTL